MKIINLLSEKIEDTIDCAKDYISAAIQYKNEYPEVSKALYTVSDNEMNNMNVLHSAVTKVISDYRKESGDPPASMMAVYDYLHKKHIDNAARVKTMQAMYKEG